MATIDDKFLNPGINAGATERYQVEVNPQTSVNIATLARVESGNYLFNELQYLNTNIKTAPPVKFDNYEIANQAFGVISHVDTSHQLFLDATRGIDNLRLELKRTTERSLIRRIENYIDELYASGLYGKEILDNFFADVKDWENYASPAHGSYKNPGDKSTIPDPRDSTKTLQITETSYTALYSTGDVIRKDIRLVDKLRRALVRFHAYQKKVLKDTQSKLADVESRFAEAHRELAGRNRQRLKSLGDYQVVRNLVAENWAEVERQYAERARILDNHQGLYYARVRETPVSARPLEPLALRFGDPDDLVPGCPLEDNELPEGLLPFMESVLDIPMAEWAALAPHYKLLPARSRLRHLLGNRAARLHYRLNQSEAVAGSLISLRLGRLHSQNRTLVRDRSRKTQATGNSLVEYQRSCAQLLSLEDLLNGPPHRLRGMAENLRNKLDQASHCLLKELRNVTPSIRLEWSEAAEGDALNVSRPTQWPGLAKAEAKDFNGVRTLIELVQWWWRQLAPEAGASAHTAVRNLIRAALMVAAADDPEQILHGQLVTVPGRFRLGDALRVKLNREALPGTLLQLVDTHNQLVGTLTVDDQDDESAIATITRLQTDAVAPSTNFTVTGFALPGRVRV